MGIADSITCPTFNPEYAEAIVKITQKNNPQPMDRPLSSANRSWARTIGWYFSPAFSGL